jgi:hypothetical protein
MTEVHSGLEQLLHADFRHRRCFYLSARIRGSV